MYDDCDRLVVHEMHQRIRLSYFTAYHVKGIVMFLDIICVSVCLVQMLRKRRAYHSPRISVTVRMKFFDVSTNSL